MIIGHNLSGAIDSGRRFSSGQLNPNPSAKRSLVDAQGTERAGSDLGFLRATAAKIATPREGGIPLLLVAIDSLGG